MPFFCLSSYSISDQYSSALPIPISFRNLTLSSFDFLLIVMSFTIFSVDSLILKGSSLRLGCFSLERDLYSESELQDFVAALLTLLCARGLLMLASLTVKVTQPQNSATCTLSAGLMLVQLLGSIFSPSRKVPLLELRSMICMFPSATFTLRWFLLMVWELMVTDAQAGGLRPRKTRASVKEYFSGQSLPLLKTEIIISIIIIIQNIAQLIYKEQIITMQSLVVLA